MKSTKGLSYGDLAWTEPIIAPPGEYAGENELYVNIIREHARDDAKEILHLACGAGGNDFTFKKHFTVTGVDISQEMLAIAKELNPEVTYVLGDMRSVDLGKRFDAVVIPDSIDYAATLPELEMTIATACKHLKPDGVLLIVAKTREEFQENNFCYTGGKEDIEITVFENNHVCKTDRSSYEATIIYLIRRKEHLKIYTDRHVLGLFSHNEWLSTLRDAGLSVKHEKLEGFYDRFILGDGYYPMQAYIGIKPA